MPTIEIIGVHPIEVTDDLLAQAYEAKYGFSELAGDERRDTEEYLKAELASVVLVEAWARDRDRAFNLCDFGQSANDTLGPDDQVAYDERYLSGDGQWMRPSLVERFDERDLRFTFFLHAYDASRPILTCYGPVKPPAVAPMPRRLGRLVLYEPLGF